MNLSGNIVFHLKTFILLNCSPNTKTKVLVDRIESRSLVYIKMIPKPWILRKISTVMKLPETYLALFLLFVFRFLVQETK